MIEECPQQLSRSAAAAAAAVAARASLQQYVDARAAARGGQLLRLLARLLERKPRTARQLLPWLKGRSRRTCAACRARAARARTRARAARRVTTPSHRSRSSCSSGASRPRVPGGAKPPVAGGKAQPAQRPRRRRAQHAARPPRGGASTGRSRPASAAAASAALRRCPPLCERDAARARRRVAQAGAQWHRYYGTFPALLGMGWEWWVEGAGRFGLKPAEFCSRLASERTTVRRTRRARPCDTHERHVEAHGRDEPGMGRDRELGERDGLDLVQWAVQHGAAPDHWPVHD